MHGYQKHLKYQVFQYFKQTKCPTKMLSLTPLASIIVLRVITQSFLGQTGGKTHQNQEN